MLETNILHVHEDSLYLVECRGTNTLHTNLMTYHSHHLSKNSIQFFFYLTSGHP